MFTIIGGDGREYGPASAEQIRGWITAGRADRETKARAVGTEDWKRLGDFAEFAPPGSVPPPLAAALPPQLPAANPERALADRGTRLMARVIDWLIELLCSVPGAIVLGGEFVKVFSEALRGREPDFSQLDPGRVALGGGLLAALLLALLILQVWMITVRGQTIGKRIVGIRVVKADGSPCGFVHGWLLRELVITAIGAACSIIPIVGPLLLRPAFHVVDWCLIFRDDQQCLHDQIATTKVVKL